jgi:flavin reductase (DIM6/NTAB) family NADH-FMN oxidoreductase RutF
MPVSDEPPIVALEVWKDHFAHKAILATGDFVINIPPSEMAGTIRKLGGVSGKKVDKFEKFGLRRERSRLVKSPRLAGAIGYLECRLRREPSILKKYSVVMGDVVHAEAEESVFTDRWHPERPGPRLIHHLGGRIFYVPARKII